MYVKKESVNVVNLLASAKFQNLTYQVDDSAIDAGTKENCSSRNSL